MDTNKKLVKEAFVEGMSEETGIEKEALNRYVDDALDEILDITNGKLYHVTTRDSLDSIVDDGRIIPGYGKGMGTGVDGDGFSQSTQEVANRQLDNAVFLSSQPQRYVSEGAGDMILPVKAGEELRPFRWSNELDLMWDPVDATRGGQVQGLTEELNAVFPSFATTRPVSSSYFGEPMRASSDRFRDAVQRADQIRQELI